MTTLFEADQQRRARLVREHDAKVRKPAPDKPTMLVRIVLGGRAGEVEILQRFGGRQYVPLGVYACFPIHDGSELLEPDAPPVYDGPSKADADRWDEQRRQACTASFRPTSICRGKKRTERGIHHRWTGPGGRCAFCKKTRDQAKLQPPITLEQALKGN